MASIVSGFEYDIFISYRHKDNKGDHWVTEFVNALKGELESTFKEDISIYFDENPHDGLHAHHDVDDSLKEKLKCLVLIPIISRTYCDPNSFAWKFELCAFVDQAKEDGLGLKVKLANGNVANRVLPIRVHELDKTDASLFETVTGSVMRPIDFIFKSSGVNRPLRPNEDHPHDNSNKTFYRDQVNKVANAIRDVLNGITSKDFAREIPETEAVDQIGSATLNKKKVHEAPTVSFQYRLKNFASVNKKSLVVITFILLIGAMNFGSYWFGLMNSSQSLRPLIKYEIPLTRPLGATNRHSLAISPDGEFLVFVMNGELYLKSLKTGAPAVLIAGTKSSRDPFFSSDSKWIGFENSVDNHLMKVPLRGGNPTKICDLEESFGINWFEHDIYFAVGKAVFRVPDSGGTPELVYPLSKSQSDPYIKNPQLLPDRKTILFSQLRDDESWDIRTWTLGSNESSTVLVARGRDGRFLNSGHIAYSQDHVLYVNKFDSKTNRLIGEPEVITTKPIFENAANSVSYGGVSQFDFSDNGVLVYYENQALTRDLVWIENSGTIMPITSEAKVYTAAAVSSDAQNIAVEVWSLDGGSSKIEIINAKSGNSTLFEENARSPRWSKDNASIIYVRDKQVFEKPLDLSVVPKQLFKLDSAQNLFLGKLSFDGKYLPLQVFFSPAKTYEIGYYDMTTGKVEMLDHYNSRGFEGSARISPDGKWLAYQAAGAIYLAPFPGPGLPTKISSDGLAPFWSPDMNALYYTTSTHEIWKVNLQTKPNFSWGIAKSIFNGGTSIEPISIIHPDGNRFMGSKAKESAPEINVVVNWDQNLVSE